MTADVEKAFLQILLCQEDGDALRFLWFKTLPQVGRPLPEQEIWRMDRVSFGATLSFFVDSYIVAPFLATRKKNRSTARLLQESM